MSYTLNEYGIVRQSDGALIPIDPRNSDYVAYLEWEALGNTPDPIPEIPVEDRRAEVWEKVKAERTRRKDGGVQVGGHWFQSDSDSRIQLLRLDQKATAALAAGGSSTDVLTIMGQPLYWKTTDNGLVPMTVALAQGIATAIEVLDALAFSRGEVLRAQIDTSQDPESIDITTGWPAIYGA